jgi:hypothetical protein
MLPSSVVEELHDHWVRVKWQHQQDLERGFEVVSLPFALGRKYPNANRDWVWQFVFPPVRLLKTRVVSGWVGIISMKAVSKKR